MKQYFIDNDSMSLSKTMLTTCDADGWSIQSYPLTIIMNINEKTFIQDPLEILKPTLQNC